MGVHKAGNKVVLMLFTGPQVRRERGTWFVYDFDQTAQHESLDGATPNYFTSANDAKRWIDKAFVLETVLLESALEHAAGTGLDKGFFLLARRRTA